MRRDGASAGDPSRIRPDRSSWRPSRRFRPGARSLKRTSLKVLSSGRRLRVRAGDLEVGHGKTDLLAADAGARPNPILRNGGQHKASNMADKSANRFIQLSSKNCLGAALSAGNRTRTPPKHTCRCIPAAAGRRCQCAAGREPPTDRATGCRTSARSGRWKALPPRNVKSI